MALRLGLARVAKDLMSPTRDSPRTNLFRTSRSLCRVEICGCRAVPTA